MRDAAVAELCRAIDELDEQTLQRILVYAVDRLEQFSHGDPRVKLVRNPDGTPQITQLEEAIFYKKETEKRIARAEKGVRTRKANKAKKEAAKKTTKPINAGAYRVREELAAAENGITSKQLSERTKLVMSAVYYHLKRLGAYSNGKGLWWADKKTYLARFPIAGRGKKAAKNKLANGAAEKTP
jgi:hypothetical protein